VAARYAAEPDTRRRLADKIRNGGKGAWGQVPMPPNAGLSEAEAQTLAAWVLQQK
jgi:cytochrome c